MLTCPQRAQAHERDHRQIENEQEEDAEGVMQRVPDYTESPVRKALQIYEEKNVMLYKKPADFCTNKPKPSPCVSISHPYLTTSREVKLEALTTAQSTCTAFRDQEIIRSIKVSCETQDTNVCTELREGRGSHSVDACSLTQKEGHNVSYKRASFISSMIHAL